MSAKLKIFCATATFWAGVTASGCQTYDFEPVEPLAIAQTTQARTVIAKQLKPDLMLLVDKSGSMAFPTSLANPNCPANCGATASCPVACPTRWSEMSAAMDTFLTTSGGSARMGYIAFPIATDVCGAPSLTEITANGVELNQSATDADAELKATAATILTKIKATTPKGGTPTAPSLRMLGTYPKLQGTDREDFILLLTDGLPNCNSSLSGATCTCTGATCTDARNCLDNVATVAAVKDLKAQGIRTIVVGFGADLGSATAVLGAMADEGGFARSCPNGTDAECAPGTCVAATKLCSTKYYQAADGTALAKALEQIGRLVGTGDPCAYKLDATPSDPKFLTVIIDGLSTTTGTETWTYAAGTVTFVGAMCTKLSNATPNAPVKVEFRIVEGL
jgi:hypothetical protein